MVYFKATETDKKDNDVQVARLLNLLGQDGLKIYITIKDDKEETVKSILEALDEYCIPKTNEIMDHFNFFKRNQQLNEQLDVWYTDLKKLIKNCNFGDAKDKILRTQIVLGVYDKETQSRLLRDGVSLPKMMSYCQAIERAESNRKVLTTNSEAERAVYEVRIKYSWGRKI